MKTYLNELHKKYKDSHTTNYTSNLSTTNKKDQDLSGINNNIPQNKLTKNKSGLFLNNFFRTNNASNGKICNSLKKSSNTINTIKNYKKKKKINITPYQSVKNEYILNLAMDNLNKCQEDLLLKENNNENWNNENIMNIKSNLENEIYKENNNDEFGYYSMNKKNDNIILNKNKQMNPLMNRTQENFHPNNNFYKNNISLNNKYGYDVNRSNNNTINNYYNEFYIKDDIFNKNINNENNQYNNNITNPESYLTKRTTKNFSNNNYNTTSNKNNHNNINNINYERNYENKFNLFINKTFKNENSKQNNNNNINNNVNNNQIMNDKKLIYILHNLELEELIDIFEKNYIFFDDLFLLSKEDFVEMKIPIGPRNRIINFIEKYKKYSKTYDFDELTLFMNKYKKILLNTNSNINNNFNINVTPTTNNKYKSSINSENNPNKKSFNSQGSDAPGRGLNMSNFDENETLSPRNEELKINKYFNSKPKNKNKSNINNNDKKNMIIKDMNKLINSNTNITKSNNEKIINSPIDDNIQTNKINENIIKCTTSRINNFSNLNNIETSNDNSANLFSNSLFNEYGTNINNINEIYNKNLETINKNKRNINTYNPNNQNNSFKSDNINHFLSTNSSKIKDSLIDKNNINILNNNNNNKYDSPSLNFLNNKLNYKPINPYKNFQNIFSEIENYQINYEKMKKENDERNNKINNLLEKKNRPNIQYLKMKIKNCKYFNDDDLKNESERNLENELQKMNFQKDNDNNQLNSIKYNPSMQAHIKTRDKSKNKNPLMEQFEESKS